MASSLAIQKEGALLTSDKLPVFLIPPSPLFSLIPPSPLFVPFIKSYQVDLRIQVDHAHGVLAGNDVEGEKVVSAVVDLVAVAAAGDATQRQQEMAGGQGHSLGEFDGYFLAAGKGAGVDA